jgi:hypothetical protein
MPMRGRTKARADSRNRDRGRAVNVCRGIFFVDAQNQLIIVGTNLRTTLSAPQDGLSSNATEVSHDERLLRCLFAASWYRAALRPGVGFDRRMVKETYATAPTSACPLDFFRFAAAWVGSNLKNVTAPVHKRMPRTRGELILPFCTSALPEYWPSASKR